MLTFASDFGNEAGALAAAAAEPGAYIPSGPTRATSIVACLPAFVDASGELLLPACLFTECLLLWFLL